MSKGLRTAAVIVGAVALVATGVGAAAGAGLLGSTAAAAAAGSAAAGASAVGGIITAAATVASVATVASAALALGAQVTARPPPLGGAALRFKADKDAGLPYVIGRTATGGNIIYQRTHNSAGYSLPDLRTFAVLLSCAGPVNAIEAFTADRVVTGFSAGAATGAYAGWMWQTQQLGQSPESAALRVTPGGTLPPGWTTAAKMSGLAAAMWTLRYDQKGKFYAQGVPVPLWILQGVKVYDPRLDSTYPGGSGACRSNDESTFVYSENPFLHGLTWALGRYQNGKRVIGIGAPVTGIDVRAFVEGANVADANGWKVGGTVYTTDGKWTVLKTMLQAGVGEPMHLGAMLSCTVSTPRVALATVTVADLIGRARVSATTSRRGRLNSIIPRYRSEAHNWEMIPAAPVTVASHVTEDGGLRQREREYSLCQDLDQVATLARYEIENGREFGPVVLPLKLRWLGYRPGDCINVVLPEVGLNGQDVVIGNREIDPAGLGVTLTGRSETTAKHAFALGQTTVAPPTPSVSTPPVPPQPGAVAWSLSGAGLVAGATVTPALIITGAAASVPIDAVVVEYRLWVSGQADSVGWIGNGAYLPDVERVEITAVLPSTAYDVAVSYRLGAFTGPRRIIGPVTTTAAGLEWGGVGGAGRPDSFATGSDNMLQNAGLAADSAGWAMSAGVDRIVGSAIDPGTFFRFEPSLAAQVVANSNTPIPLNGAAVLYGSVYAQKDPLVTGFSTFTAVHYWFKADGTASGTPITVVSILPAAAAVWEFLTYNVIVPADAASVIYQQFTATTGGRVYTAGMRLAPTQLAADVTAQNTAVLTMPAGPVIRADFTGAVLSGQLPRTAKATRTRGGVDVSSSTTWGVTPIGCSASIDSDGLVTITAITSTGRIVVTSTRDGLAMSDEFPVIKETQPPPAPGGSGSGSASDSSITSINSNSYGGEQAGPLTVTAAAGGVVTLSAPLSFSSASAINTRGKWLWRLVGGSYADVAAEINSSIGSTVGEPDSGYIEISQSQTGLTPGSDYEFVLQLRRSTGTGTVDFSGTASAVAS